MHDIHNVSHSVPALRAQERGPSSGPAATRADKLAQAAQQFEAIFLRDILKEMRKTDALLASKDDPLNSDTARMMQGCYDDALCDFLARQHGVGLAALIVKQLTPRREGG